MAKGRRGRNYDGWVAPPLTIAALTWQILLGMAATFLFFLIITITLLRVSPWSARGPYLLLAFVTLALIASCVLSAVSMRSLVIDNITKLRLSSASSFLGAVQDAFLPAVILYLLHLRGNVLRGVKGNTVTPIASQLWKRILDWSWVTLTFIFYLVLLGYRANWYNNLLSSMLTEDLFRQYVNISRGLAYTIDALRFLLFLNVIVSMIVHFVQSKNAQARDPVTTRLLIMAAPSFMIYAILSVAVDIILNVAATTATFNIEAFILAATIIMGICGIMILVALVNTMLLPNVQWTPQKAVTPMEHRGALVQ
ncbi:hypothetical protein M408DRAFT_329040 [Serendipita vermifera MAFF 305830]|uniref:Uncharacterized protein n=1 Tax=Serendipita vermifera MAFF 305830 TaxID=933852 RepID=A0A0C3BC30_SERVB|nr:hypothetical protein M408DRAFT_329040 [Serendipita vermifera MAFF 305830]